MKPLPLILVAIATFAVIKQASLLGMSDGRDPVVWGAFGVTVVAWVAALYYAVRQYGGRNR